MRDHEGFFPYPNATGPARQCAAPYGERLPNGYYGGEYIVLPVEVTIPAGESRPWQYRFPAGRGWGMQITTIFLKVTDLAGAPVAGGGGVQVSAESIRIGSTETIQVTPEDGNAAGPPRVVADREPRVERPSRSQLRPAPRRSMEPAGQLSHAVLQRRCRDGASQSPHLHCCVAVRAGRPPRRHRSRPHGCDPASRPTRLRRAHEKRHRGRRAACVLPSRHQR